MLVRMIKWYDPVLTVYAVVLLIRLLLYLVNCLIWPVYFLNIPNGAVSMEK